MITSNRVNFSILLSTFALNPKEVDLNERKLISGCVFGRKIWWLEYHYQDRLNLNESEIENYDKIVFCRRLLVLLGDLKAWTEKYKFETFSFQVLIITQKMMMMMRISVQRLLISSSSMSQKGFLM